VNNENNIKNILHSRIRELRKTANLTQGQLAEKLSVGQSAVNRYEVDRIPSIEVLDEIATVFNVSVDWLLGRTNDPGALEPKSPSDLSIDDLLDQAVSQILGADISDDLNEEMRHRLKSVLLRERKELRHRNFLRNFEGLIELALDSAIEQNDLSEKQELQRQELIRLNRRRRKLNRFEVQQFLYDYGLIKTKTDAVLHRIENEIMKNREMIALGELEDYIREECETQLRFKDNSSSAQSAG